MSETMSETMTTTKTEALCVECGEPLSDEEIEAPADYGDGPVCYECYRDDHYWTCGFCGEDREDEEESDLFAVFDVDAAGVAAGIYRILETPFYSQGLTGGGRIFEWAVQRVADLPEGTTEDEDGYPCIALCQSCAKPYRNTEEEPAK